MMYRFSTALVVLVLTSTCFGCANDVNDPNRPALLSNAQQNGPPSTYGGPLCASSPFVGDCQANEAPEWFYAQWTSNSVRNNIRTLKRTRAEYVHMHLYALNETRWTCAGGASCGVWQEITVEFDPDTVQESGDMQFAYLRADSICMFLTADGTRIYGDSETPQNYWIGGAELAFVASDRVTLVPVLQIPVYSSWIQCRNPLWVT